MGKDPSKEKWWGMLHTLWTWAVGKPGYDKRAWQEFESELESATAQFKPERRRAERRKK